jgi:hypothetical protein
MMLQHVALEVSPRAPFAHEGRSLGKRSLLAAFEDARKKNDSASCLRTGLVRRKRGLSGCVHNGKPKKLWTLIAQGRILAKPMLECFIGLAPFGV